MTINEVIEQQAEVKHTCKGCHIEYVPPTKRSVYCNRACKDSSANKRRPVKKDPLLKGINSGFFRWLATNAQRAGTVQVMHGNDEDSLCTLYRDLHCASMGHNGYGAEHWYEICHICPTSGHSRLGLLHPDNLIIADATLNKKHGTKWFGGGASLSRDLLQNRWNVSPNDSLSTVIIKVIQYLGRPLCLAVIKRCKIKPTQRFQLLGWVTTHYDPTNWDHIEALPNGLAGLDSLKTQELSNIKAVMTGKGAYKLNFAGTPAHIVAVSQLQRLAAGKRPELLPFIDVFSAALATSNGHQFTKKTQYVQLVFDLLHGRSLESVQGKLDIMIDTITVVSQAVTDVHTLASGEQYTRTYRVPMSLKASRAYVAAEALKVSQSKVFKLEILEPTKVDYDFDDFNGTVPGAVIVPIQIAHNDPYDNYSSPF